MAMAVRRAASLALLAPIAFAVGCTAARPAPAGAEGATPAPRGAPAFEDSLRAAERSARPEEFVRLLDAAIAAELAPDPAPPAIDPERVLASLPPTTAMLALLPSGDASSAAVYSALLTSRGVRVRVLDAPSARVMAARYHAWMKDPGVRAFDRRAARDLHRELVEPWSRWMRAATSLVLVPGGYLRGIPFETTLQVEGEDLEESMLPYLARRFGVSYEPTLGSRLLWHGPDPAAPPFPLESGADPIALRANRGALVTTTGLDPADRFRIALRAARAGARGALLGWGAPARVAAPDAPGGAPRSPDPPPCADPVLAEFLRRSREGGDSDAAALRAIQRAPGPELAGPAVWARFSLFGAPETDPASPASPR